MEELVQGAPRHQLGDDEGVARVPAAVEDLGDTRMRQPRRGARLPEPGRVLARVWPVEDLQGDVAVEHLVVRAIDAAHAAAADQLAHYVPSRDANPRPARQRPGVRVIPPGGAYRLPRRGPLRPVHLTVVPRVLS